MKQMSMVSVPYGKEHFSFGAENGTKIIAMSYPQNTGSLRVIEKLGFKSIGKEEHFGKMLDVFEMDIMEWLLGLNFRFLDFRVIYGKTNEAYLCSTY